MVQILQRRRDLFCLALCWVVSAGATLAELVPTRHSIEELGPFGGPEECGAMSVASGINELGHAVGAAEHAELIEVDYGDGNGPVLQCAWWSHAVLWRDGEMIELEPLFENGFASAKGINDLDHVVGQAAAILPDGSGAAIGVPFLWTEEGGMVDLTGGANFHGWAWGINNFDEVATDGNGGQAFFWTGEEGFRPIEMENPSSYWSSTAWEVNHHGVVVGNAASGDDFLHAYRYDSQSGAIEDLHDRFFRTSGAYGLNDNADIAGWTVAYSHQIFGSVWPKEGEPIVLPLGEMVVDGVLRWDLVYGQAEHMNSHGDVVGETISFLPTPPVGWIAFEVLDGEPVQKIPLVDLLSPEDRARWEITAAMEINDARQIVGIGRLDGLGRGFIMTPDYSVTSEVPLPSSGPSPSVSLTRILGDGTSATTQDARRALRGDRDEAAAGDRRFDALPVSLRPRSLVGTAAGASPVAPREVAPAGRLPERSGRIAQPTPAAPLEPRVPAPSGSGAGSVSPSSSGERNDQ